MQPRPTVSAFPYAYLGIFRRAPPDGVVQITHEMELVHIITVDELKQTMRVLVYVIEVTAVIYLVALKILLLLHVSYCSHQEWEDATLSWDPTNFSGLRITWIPEESIWVPDIIVFNMCVFKLTWATAPVLLSKNFDSLNAVVSQVGPSRTTAFCALSDTSTLHRQGYLLISSHLHSHVSHR